MATAKRPASKRVSRAAAPAAPAKADTSPSEKPPTADLLTPLHAKKAKRIRGEFAMPKADYDRIAKLKATAKRAGVKAKKNELLRLGLKALQGMPANELKEAVLSLRVPKAGAVG